MSNEDYCEICGEHHEICATCHGTGRVTEHDGRYTATGEALDTRPCPACTVTDEPTDKAVVEKWAKSKRYSVTKHADGVVRTLVLTDRNGFVAAMEFVNGTIIDVTTMGGKPDPDQVMRELRREVAL